MNNKESNGTSAMVQVLAVIGLIALGVIIVPVVVGLVAALPDIARYIRIKRM